MRIKLYSYLISLSTFKKFIIYSFQIEMGDL